MTTPEEAEQFRAKRWVDRKLRLRATSMHQERELRRSFYQQEKDARWAQYEAAKQARRGEVTPPWDEEEDAVEAREPVPNPFESNQTVQETTSVPILPPPEIGGGPIESEPLHIVTSRAGPTPEAASAPTAPTPPELPDVSPPPDDVGVQLQPGLPTAKPPVQTESLPGSLDTPSPTLPETVEPERGELPSEARVEPSEAMLPPTTASPTEPPEAATGTISEAPAIIERITPPSDTASHEIPLSSPPLEPASVPKATPTGIAPPNVAEEFGEATPTPLSAIEGRDASKAPSDTDAMFQADRPLPSAFGSDSTPPPPREEIFEPDRPIIESEGGIRFQEYEPGEAPPLPSPKLDIWREPSFPEEGTAMGDGAGEGEELATISRMCEQNHELLVQLEVSVQNLGEQIGQLGAGA